MKAKFIEAVEGGNLLRTRLFIVNELLLDPRGESFLEMKRFAEMHLVDLYDRDDSKRYVSNEFEWTEELLFQIKNDLDDNFSKEKLDIYEIMAKVVLRDKIDELNNQDAIRSARMNGMSDKTNNNGQEKRPVNKLYAGITLGSAIVAVTGLCLSCAALASLGLAGVIIGGFLLFKDLKK